MDNKTFAIGILSLTAVVLLGANFLLETPADAGLTIKDRDYQVVTARIQAGGEALYILDNKTGLVAVFAYDANARGLRARAVRLVTDCFTASARR